VKKQAHKNKAVIKDQATGLNWWATAKGKVYPTNWKLQCGMITQQVHQREIQEKLYGKPK
jgi:hypothetical protein